MKESASKIRKRLTLKGEFLLALFPTATVLVVLAIVDVLSEQKLLFSSLASSAFLIYLDPEHGTNSIRTLIISQLSAALIGFILFIIIGPGYTSASAAIVCIIILMVTVEAVHPPAVSTALSFALRTGDESNIAIFALAVGITATLVVLEKVSLYIIAKLAKEHNPKL